MYTGHGVGYDPVVADVSEQVAWKPKTAEKLAGTSFPHSV
jgi:hypothetical protein